MASYLTGGSTGQHPLTVLRNQKGVALITAILVSVAILAMSMGTLYFVHESTRMSGAGKKYSTAEEVAEGAVRVAEKTILMVNRAAGVEPGIFGDSDCIEEAIITGACTTTITLTPAVAKTFATTVRIEKIFVKIAPGARIEFPPVYGSPTGANFYRVSATVRDKATNHILTESSVVYRTVNN